MQNVSLLSNRPPPPIPHFARPNTTQTSPQINHSLIYPPLPFSELPTPSTPLKPKSPPLIHLHPDYLFEIRSQVKKDSIFLKLLTNLCKKVMEEQEDHENGVKRWKRHSVTFAKHPSPLG
jgi:hypothetical protein